MVNLLLEHGAGTDSGAVNGLRPLHLAAQEDHVPIAEVLVNNEAEIDPQTKVDIASSSTVSLIASLSSF